VRIRPGVLCLLAIAGLGFPACGGDDEAAEPAALVPEGASLYAEAVVRPEGDQADAIDEALAKLAGEEDVGGRIVAELNAALSEQPGGLTWGEDIEPWLGERAAFFIAEIESAADLEEGEGQGGFLLEQTDEDAAREFVEAAAATEPEIEEASYEEVDYWTDGEFAAGVVGDYLVFTNDSLFTEVVDLESGDGGRLADEEEFSSDTDELAEDSLGQAWVDVPQFVEILEASGEITPDERAAVDALFGPLFDQPIAAAVGVTSDSLSFEVSAAASDEPVPGAIAAGTDLLESLPGESWLALGSPDVGRYYESLLSGFEASGVPDAAQIPEMFDARTGLELDRLLGALGDAAFFAQGTSLLAVGGGVVVETGDPPAIADALEVVQERLERDRSVDVGPLALPGGGDGFTISIPDAPSAAHVVLRDDRLVIAYGDEAAAQALEPESELTGSDSFGTAREGLGEDFEVGGFVDFGPLVELLGATPAAADPEFAQARPFLENLAYLAFGSRVEDDRSISRIVLGLE
jgi:hypothetical protein